LLLGTPLLGLGELGGLQLTVNLSFQTEYLLILFGDHYVECESVPEKRLRLCVRNHLYAEIGRIHNNEGLKFFSRVFYRLSIINHLTKSVLREKQKQRRFQLLRKSGALNVMLDCILQIAGAAAMMDGDVDWLHIA
jgi:hypothetical protein